MLLTIFLLMMMKISCFVNQVFLLGKKSCYVNSENDWQAATKKLHLCPGIFWEILISIGHYIEYLFCPDNFFHVWHLFLSEILCTHIGAVHILPGQLDINIIVLMKKCQLLNFAFLEGGGQVLCL